jgi:hypothetical protein
MNSFRDNEFQDSRSVGSLRSALGLWQDLLVAGTDSHFRPVVFHLRCASESRAHRVAGFLRRRRACAITRVSWDPAGEGHWRLDGATRHEVQTLANLEHLFTWLRRAAHSHQVDLATCELGSHEAAR